MIAASPEAYRLMLEGAQALARVEHNGIRIDTDLLQSRLAETGEQIRTLQDRLRQDEVYSIWRKRFGSKATLGSKPQLGEVIFGEMGYPCELEATKTGRYSTEEAAFARVDLPFIKDYFRLEKLRKVRGTYLEGIAREVQDGYLHPSYNLHTVATYRGSSDSPNFQNIPIRNPEIGKMLRTLFIPRRKDWCLVETDFAGIEVRVACCYTKDPVLIEEFTTPGKDPHRDTASQLFILPVEFLKENASWAKKTVRDWAKNRFVFPQFYGSVFFQCAPHLWEAVEDGSIALPDGTPVLKHLENNGITGLGEKVSDWGSGRIATAPGTYMEHVRQVEEDFWGRRFKVYTAWKKRQWREYLANGHYRTLTGFVVRWGAKAGFMARNDALNYGIQGSAFHCLLWVLIELVKELRRRKMRAKVIGQIHDCILGDVPNGEVDEYLDIVRDLITRRLAEAWGWIIVPMEFEAEVCPPGESWYAKKVWVETDGKWGARS